MEQHNSTHYQSDFKSSSIDHFVTYYPHPLTIEIEKRGKQDISKESSVLKSPRYSVYIIDELIDWLTYHHQRTLSRPSK
jgi:hypothetical protein